ncbi:MAG: alpha/beta hydrolase, partial [Actinomycetota bacterium]
MTDLVEPRVERAVELADGRSIGVAEFGSPDGRTIVWLHGTPGARRQVPPAARALTESGEIRIIGVERPGVGLSTPHLHRNVAGFAEDVEQVLDAVGADAVGGIGLSGGGPYTLACAHRLEDRVAAAVVLGGVAPTTGDEAVPGGLVDLAHRFRLPLGWLRAPLGAGMTVLARALRPVEGPMLELYARVSPEGDRRAFASPGMKRMFLDDLGTGAAGAGLLS